MSEIGQPVVVVTDTSVLVNFLCIDRMDLIARHSHSFVVTDHVIEEITEHYPEQQARLKVALATGILELMTVSGDEALALFGVLSETRRLGSGESAAIALAIANNYAIAIDDRAAARQARELKADLIILGSQDVIVHHIRSGEIDLAEADGIKETWAAHHRFRLPISSFSEVL